jgi:hypothetical protein
MRVRIFGLLALSLAAAPAPGVDLGTPEVARTLDGIRPEAIRAHMRFLADDLLEGRGTGTRGHQLGALYVATQFEALGLTPAGDNGTYYQEVALRQAEVKTDGSRVSIRAGSGTHELNHLVDAIVAPNYLRENASVEGSVIFVGFGVTAPERGYDDYAGADVRGKIVAILSGAPASLPGTARAHYSSSVVKAKNAAAHGAIGVLVFDTPEGAQSFPWQFMVQNARFARMKWRDTAGQIQDFFPQLQGAAYLAPSATETLFEGTKTKVSEVFAAAKTGRLKPIPLEARVAIQTRTTFSDLASPNVVGVVEGSDPELRHEYVIYTAHVDHLGIGAPVDSDAIYNGALDDASGVAGLLEIARAFAAMAQRPKRSILFLAVTAEEKGLLGSDYFAHRPTVPIDAIVADVNLDGLSILYPIRDVVGLGAEDSSLGADFERAAARVGLVTSPDPMPEQVYFIRSDQYSFVKQGVPSIFADAGLQSSDPKVDGRALTEEWNKSVYHSPKDDMKQPLDFESGARLTRMQFLIGLQVASASQRPTWKPGDFFGETYARKH